MRTTQVLALLSTLLSGILPPVHAESVMEQWAARYNAPGSTSAIDFPSAVTVDGTGNVIVTGYSISSIYDPDEDDNIYFKDACTVKYAAGNGALLWERRSTEPGDSSTNAVAVDSGGNVLVTGFSTKSDGTWEIYTAKYAAADGAILWEKRHNGTGNSVVVNDAGDVIVTGASSGGANGSDYYTAKYAAADGALLWEKSYNGPANSTDIAIAVALDGAGNVNVTGYSYGSGGNDDYYTAKYAAADGALLWEKRYNGPANRTDRATAMAVDSAGNVIVTGYSYGTIVTTLADDYYTAKYAAADGALLWEKRYNAIFGIDSGADRATAVAVDSAGNAIVTGSSYGNPGGSDYYTAKYAAANGALLWEKRYNKTGYSHDGATAVALDSAGNAIVTGYTWDGGGPAPTDVYTAKYAAANGALLWEKSFDGGLKVNETDAHMAVDGAGNVIVTGSGSGSRDFYTVRYAAANGAPLWEKLYNGSPNGSDTAYAVAVDGTGNVIITGTSVGDYYTTKYAAANGALLWEKRYNGPGNIDDWAYAVAVDSAGNVIVTGASYAVNGGSNTDYYTAKYAAADGALLWEKRYDGPASGWDAATAVAVDSAGNAIVIGYSYGGSVNYYDCYTAKYAAADGALLWERRYNGPANDWDSARAVAVDSAGNVIVSGFTDMDEDEEHGDYYTAKYAAADGALLWEQRHNGKGNALDYVTAVAVDSAGNAIVIGYSYSGSVSKSDYYTAKYAAADGALLWEQRYNGPGNTYDYAQSVVVDSVGNAFVTGYSDDASFYTAKYAAADGALLWERREMVASPPVDDDIFTSVIALDGAGNAIVTRTSPDSSDGTDFYTAKYTAADGALLWEQRYNGPGNAHDFVRAIAVDRAENVIVAGSSVTRNTHSDYATVKYAPGPDLDFDNDGLLDPWELGRFGTTVGHSALDDFDLDGRVELLEMAFVGDPRMPDAEVTPAVVEEGGYLTITVAKQAGVAYLVQSAGTPDATAFSASTTTLLLETATMLKARDNFPIAGGGNRFLRVKVIAAP